MRRIDHKIAYLLILAVVLGTGLIFATKYFFQSKNNLTAIEDDLIEEEVAIVPEAVSETSPAVREKIAKEPPKHSTKQTVTTSGQVTTVGSPDIASADYLNNCNPGSTPNSVPFLDETGRYPTLGAVLKDYLSRLRWGGEINSFCGISVTDAGDTGWSGQYIASYVATTGGDIISAKGAIILNSSYYSQLNQIVFNEYMKLILSHEYGHHYTQYHKWVDLNLPVNVRFPDQYYSVRPLSKSATVVDCSLSWSTCESEIIAEDYSYLYSGYGLHQMASLFNYPSEATRTWLDSLTSATPAVPEPQPTPPANQNQNSANSNSNTNTNTNTNTNSAPTDTTKPIVSIVEPTNPYAWDVSVANLIIKIRSTDNVGVIKVKAYINGQYQGEWSYANLDLSWAYSNAPAGTYIFKAEAYDAAGNIGEISITINKS